MRTEFEIWRDELNGRKPKRSSWWLVAVATIMVAVALKFL